MKKNYCITLCIFVLCTMNLLSKSHTSSSNAWYGVIDKKDCTIAAALTASSGIAAACFLKDHNNRSILTVIPVLFFISRLISTTRVAKSFLNQCPLVSTFFGCTSRQCEGICNQCEIQQIGIDALAVAGGLGVTMSLKNMVNRLQKKAVQKNDQEAAGIDKGLECGICYEKKDPQYCSRPLCCKESQVICGECLKNYYKSKKREPVVNCPYCRAGFECPIPKSSQEEDSQTTEPLEVSPLGNNFWLKTVTVSFLSAIDLLIIKGIVHNVPLLKNIFLCDNDGCRGICAHCKLRSAYRTSLVVCACLFGYNYCYRTP